MKSYSKNELESFSKNALDEELKYNHNIILHYDRSLSHSLLALITIAIGLTVQLVSLEKSKFLTTVEGLLFGLFVSLICMAFYGKKILKEREEYKKLLLSTIHKRDNDVQNKY